jgi:hypothetical protein
MRSTNLREGKCSEANQKEIEAVLPSFGLGSIGEVTGEYDHWASG